MVSNEPLRKTFNLLSASFLFVMCLTTTFIVAILGMIAAIKYRIHTLCPKRPPRFPSGDGQNYVENEASNGQMQDESIRENQAKTE